MKHLANVFIGTVVYLCALVWTPLSIVVIPAALADGHWLLGLWLAACWPFNVYEAVHTTRRLWNGDGPLATR